MLVEPANFAPVEYKVATDLLAHARLPVAAHGQGECATVVAARNTFIRPLPVRFLPLSLIHI